MSNVNTFSNPREPVARIVGASGILRNNFDVFEPGDLVAAAKLQYVPLSLDAICPISTEVA